MILWAFYSQILDTEFSAGEETSTGINAVNTLKKAVATRNGAHNLR